MIRRPHARDADAFQEALGSTRPASGELAELVRTAETLCASAAATAPREEFRVALRERLMVEAAETLVQQEHAGAAPAARPVAAPSPVRRRVAALAGTAVAAVGAVGMVTTSASAVPGDALYPVKRGVENVELALQRGETERGDYRFELAAERLEEATALVAQGAADGPTVSSLLTDFTRHAEAGAAEHFTVFGEAATPASVEAVNAFVTTSAAELGALSGLAPAGADAALRDAAGAVADLAGQAARLCGACDASDLSALVGAVERAAADRGTTAPQPTPASETVRPTSSATVAPSTSASPAPRPSATSRPAPSPTATTRPAPLEPVLEPVLTGLLGDDEATGLVPGLLGGLLG